MKEANYQLQFYGEKIIKERSLWPWTLTLCGQIWDECGDHKGVELCSALLEVQPAWPVSVAYSALVSAQSAAWGRLLELEHMLEVAVGMQCWPYAAELLHILAKLAPGYLSHLACASTLPNWRRAFFAAIIEHGIGHTEMAFRYGLAALAELEMIREHDHADIDERSSFFSHPGMVRVSNLCVNILLEAHTQNSPLGQSPENSIDEESEMQPKKRPGQFVFLVGRVGLLTYPENYPYHALFLLERVKALTLYEILQIKDTTDERGK